MKPELHVFTNGFEATWPAIEYAAWLSENMQTHLTLSGVIEEKDAGHPVEEIFGRAVALFQNKKVDYSLELENGSVEEMIIQRKDFQAQGGLSAGSEKILVLGPFGRPQVRKIIEGNSFRRLMAVVSIPILFVPMVRIPIQRVLICMGGLGYTFSAEHLGLSVAKMSNSDITLMTVVPPIDLDYPEARKIRDNLQNLTDTDTLLGKSLRTGIKIAEDAGLKANIKVRHGKIVEQIQAEVKEGQYDLVCMGSQFSSHGLRQFYTPNVTADVAEISQSPILTVRYFESKN